MSFPMPRDFKGIWIPKEIWINPNLSLFEKCLWAEIHSLDTPENGCTASNEYLCNFFGVQEKTLQRGLAKLKNIGYVKMEKFNGRIRILRASIKDIFDTSAPTSSTIKDKFDTPEVSKMSPLPRQKCHPSHIYKNKEEGIDKNKEEKERDKEKEDAPPAGPRTSSPPSLFKIFGTHVKLKEQDYKDLTSQYSKTKVDEIIESMNDYLSAKGLKPYKDYKAAIRSWIRREKDLVKSPQTVGRASRDEYGNITRNPKDEAF